MSRFTVSMIAVAAGIVLAQQNDYRNIALNPDDVHESVWSETENGYPHATSNSEYPDDGGAHYPEFYALNAINGGTSNVGHGPDFPSWGPQMRTDLWWRIDFGHEVEVDRLIIYIRADFPHDDYWHHGTFYFSDGSFEAVAFEKIADPQTFDFEARMTDYVLITDLVEDEPLDWCGFTEVEVWGYDPPTSVRPAVLRADGFSLPVMYRTAFLRPLQPMLLPGDAAHIALYTTAGRRVWTTETNPSAQTMLLPSWLSAGMYHIRCETDR